jgi:hypothetical protein
VLVSPFGIEHGTGIHLISLAENIDRAKYLADQATRVLTGKLSDTHDVTAQPFIGNSVAPAEAIVVH